MFRFAFFLLLSSTMLSAATSQASQFRRPLVFEPNRGQAPAPVKWLARGSGYELLLTSEGITMVLEETAPKGEPKSSTIRIKLDASGPWNDVSGQDPTGGVSNYMRGSDLKTSLTGIPHYGRVRVGEIYRGVDLVFYSHDGELEYDFVLKPGADPKQIRLTFEGQQGIRLDRQSGDLVLTTAGGRELRHSRPNVYQQAGQKRVPVSGNYELLSGGHAAFTLARYDRRLPLVIDPTVSFVQYFGSSGYDWVAAMAVDSFGQMYIAGGTNDLHYPVSNDSKWQDPRCSFPSFCVSASNSVVLKINSVGVMLFATYGGFGPGGASGIAVDASGVYVTGSWREPAGSDFTGFAGGISDLYILKLSPTGVPIYRSMIGGSQEDYGTSIAVDSQQSAWVAGTTRSKELHNGLNGQARAMVAKFDSAGRRVVFGTYGGNGNAEARGIAVDPSDRPWVTGQSCGAGFPLTGGVFDANGSCHVFVMQLESLTGQQRMSMAFGGSDVGDTGLAIAPNGSNTAYVTGTTNGKTFPITPGVYQPFNFWDGPIPFVTQVDSSTGTGRIVRSTYMADPANGTGATISVHVPEGVYVGGNTWLGPVSGYVSKLSLSLDRLYWAKSVMKTVAAVTVVKPAGTVGVPRIYVAGESFDGESSDGYVMGLADDLIEAQLLWQNTLTGQLSAWSLDAQGAVTSTQTLSAQCSAASGCTDASKVVGALDFDRDGVGDVLLHNASTGELQVWLLDNAGALKGTKTLPRHCGASDGCSGIWKTVGLGDFNHDGIQDLLWHNDTTGELQAWLQDRDGATSGTLTLSKRCAVSDGCWTTWKIIGIADFDHDGIDDLFWQNLSTGAVQISLLNGSGVVTATRALAKKCGPTDGCSTTWKSAGMVDLNRDGYVDLLWQNLTTGELQGWLLNGTDRILGVQSVSHVCDAASGCTPGTVPVGIFRGVAQ